MDTKFKNYPHPVLWDKNDDYQNSYFDCDISHKLDGQKFLVKLKYKLNNKGLKDLIENNQAEYLVRIESLSSCYRTMKATAKDDDTITLDDKNLLGRITFSPYIVAKEDIPSFTNDDWNIDYSGEDFYIERGTILAEGSPSYFFVDKENDDLSAVPSIFTIVKREVKEDIPMGVELNENKIIINLNYADYERYSRRVVENTDTVNAVVIFPALIYVLEKIKEDFDDYLDYRWFKALEKALLRHNLKLSKDLFSSRSSLELAQKIMNSPVSNALNDIECKNNFEEDDLI